MLSASSLSKLAFLEEMAKNYLDDFIESRMARGDTKGVPIKRFPGHVAWAHESNVRDYIGRSEAAIFDYVSQRPYLWSIDPTGYVTKVPELMRQILIETAIFINEKGKTNGGKKEAKLIDIVAVLTLKSLLESWPVRRVKKTLLQYEELFQSKPKDADRVPDSDVIISCPIPAANGSILPYGLAADLNEGVAKALAVAPSLDAAFSSGKGMEGKSGRYPGAGAKTSDGKSKRETLEGIGKIVWLGEKIGFLNYQRGIDLIFHRNVFDTPQPTPLHAYLKIGDRLEFKAFAFFDNGVQKWRASWVSKDVPEAVSAARATRTAPISEDGWTTVGERWRTLSSSATIPKKAAYMPSDSSDDDRWEMQREPGARGGDFGKLGASPDVQVRSDHGSFMEDDAVYVDMLAEIDQELESIIETPSPIAKDEVGHTDVAVQTEKTDEEILLQILRSFPNLLDEYDLVRRQQWVAEDN